MEVCPSKFPKVRRTFGGSGSHRSAHEATDCCECHRPTSASVAGTGYVKGSEKNWWDEEWTGYVSWSDRHARNGEWADAWHADGADPSVAGAWCPESVMLHALCFMNLAECFRLHAACRMIDASRFTLHALYDLWFMPCAS